MALLLFVGCSNDENVTILRGVQLSLNSVAFSADSGERIINVSEYPDGEAWSVECAAEWFDAERDGDTIVVSAESNTSTQGRSGSFSVVSDNGEFEDYVVEVVQEGAIELSVETTALDSYVFDSEGGSYTFTVVSNYDWELTTTDSWIEVVSDMENSLAIISVNKNIEDIGLHGSVVLVAGSGEQRIEKVITIEQGTRAENPYFKLVGEWEITASKWFYSPNGSLNSLDYAPSPSDYYLIFDIVEGEYGETLVMKDFLYPDTELEVRYNKDTGGFVIPFGWTVLSYDVFLYLTVINSTQFAYAALEVDAIPNDSCTLITLDMPTVSGYSYVGFGLWTYDEDGNKIAVGSTYRPTMFPMNDIRFNKRQ